MLRRRLPREVRGSRSPRPTARVVVCEELGRPTALTLFVFRSLDARGAFMINRESTVRAAARRARVFPTAASRRGEFTESVRGFRAPGCLDEPWSGGPRSGSEQTPRAPLDTVESRYTVEPRPTVRGRTREPPLEPPQQRHRAADRDLNLAKNYREGAWLRNPRSCRRAPSCPRAPTSCIRTRTGRNPSSTERCVPRRTPKTRSVAPARSARTVPPRLGTDTPTTI